MLCTLFSIIFLVTFVSCQQYVSISTPATVNYKIDKLKFICSPSNVPSTASITELLLSKNSSSVYQDVVKVFLGVSGSNVENRVKWYQTGVQNRATIMTLKVFPTDGARLEFDINATQVICSDEGTYKCSIVGNTATGQAITDDATASIAMRVSATSINQIQASPQQPEGIYNPYSSVRLTCTGTVGNPPANLRWCYRRSNIDTNFIGYPITEDIDQGTAFPQDCQFTRTSTLQYNVSADYEMVEFRCETGGTSTLCGHTSSFASNITIYRYTAAGSSGGQGGEETSNAGAIAGAVIGSLVGIIIVIVIVWFVVFRKKTGGETYKTKEENG